MKKHTLKRYLASLLAVLMLISVTGISPAVFADSTPPDLVETSADAPKEVLIKSTYSDEQVLNALASALLTNADQVGAQTLSWIYTCAVKGTYKVGIEYTTKKAREATVSVFGETQTAQYSPTGVRPYYDATYVYPALKDQADGAYTLYLNGQAVYIKKVARLTSSISAANDAIDVALPYNADGSVNTDTLHKLIFDAADITTTPEGLTYSDLSYSGNFSEGTQTVTISYAGNDDYYGTSKNVTVNFTDSRAVAFTAKDKPETLSMGFVGNNVNVEATKQAVLKQLVNKVGDVELDQIKVEYKPTVGSYNDFSELSTTKILYYKGTKTDIRLTYAGDATHKPFSAEFKDLKFADNRVAAPFTVNVPEEGVSLVFNDDTSLNYTGIENAIRAIVTSSDENLGVEDITVKYESTTGVYEPLNYKALIDSNAFGEGTQKIKLTWGGNAQYKPFEWVGEITFKDNRIQSVVAYVENASITFNMVGDEMLQAIFNDVIDKTNSTLPEGLTYKDFTYEYKTIKVIKLGDIELGQKVIKLGDIELGQKEEWVPIVGDDGYPNMNADEENGQTIRISYKGNADYKGCANEGNVTVMKADVKVSVKRLTIMHVGDTELPDNFITLDPNDTRSIEVYTFFVGINTNKETTVYLMLPESKTQLIEAISKAQRYLKISPTLEEKLNDGITIGELRTALDKIVNSPALNNKLGQMTFDSVMELMGYNFTYAQFKSLYDTMSQIASLADDLRLAIGSPSHAGIYQAIAITVSDNYNRAYGTGTVLVLMSWKDVKLQKNSVLGDSNTITASQAQDFKDNGGLCVLTRNDTVLEGDYVGNIHYWFTGLNTIYARSEMPTKPGKYLVTASVVGGDYFATPKTFVFTIVADETPNT